MTIEEIRKELSEKINNIDPLGKKLKFILDDDIMLIDGSGEKNILPILMKKLIAPLL